MEYTRSDAYVTDTSTGNRMHQSDQPVPTEVSPVDLNMVIWSLMEILKAASVDGETFDPEDASTYNRVLTSLQKLFLPQKHMGVLANGSPSHSDGTNTLVGSSRWFLGNAVPSSDDSALLIGRSLTGSYASGAHAIRDETLYLPSGAGLLAYASWDAAPTLSGGGGTYNHLRGFQARPAFSGTGTIAELTGIYVRAGNGGTGTVANCFGGFVDDPTGPGSITNNYGYWVQPLTRGSVINMAFYSAGSTPSMFNGLFTAAGGLNATTGVFSDQVLLKAAHATGVATSYNTSGGLLLSYNGSGAGQLQAYANGSGAGTSTLSLACGSAAVMNLSATAILPGADNAYSCGAGGFRYTFLAAASGTIVTSDERAKTEVEDCELGLDFINALRPVSYLYKVGKNVPVEIQDGTQLALVSPAVPPVVDEETREVIVPGVEAVFEEVPKFRTEYHPVAGSRRHWGLIAQEVKTAVDQAGVDFAGWTLDDAADPGSQQGLRYEQFVAPLIRSVQQLSAQVQNLQQTVAELQSNRA